MISNQAAERYITLIERWALGIGIIAAGGALVYLPVIGSTRFLGHWLVWPMMIAGLSLMVLAGIQFARDFGGDGRTQRRRLQVVIVWLSLLTTGATAVMATAEFVDNEKRLDICGKPEFALQPDCAVLRKGVEDKVRKVIAAEKEAKARARLKLSLDSSDERLTEDQRRRAKVEFAKPGTGQEALRPPPR